MSCAVDDFVARQLPVHALAGIGNPQRFFDQLAALGITTQTQTPFADHYQYSKQDIPDGPVLMTEKDAVKVAPFAHSDCWYLKVSAQLPAAFYQQLDTKLSRHGFL
ncbi:tetraacyldisaccharide 4'-kinase [Salinimonas marina]|uniref:tetraacyldisaccharide 4'-kinase n=1 Tax=Salinimonas marina TaxID=2785918 RepID=UPI002FC383E1